MNKHLVGVKDLSHEFGKAYHEKQNHYNEQPVKVTEHAKYIAKVFQAVDHAVVFQYAGGIVLGSVEIKAGVPTDRRRFVAFRELNQVNGEGGDTEVISGIQTENGSLFLVFKAAEWAQTLEDNSGIIGRAAAASFGGLFTGEYNINDSDHALAINTSMNVELGIDGIVKTFCVCVIDCYGAGYWFVNDKPWLMCVEMNNDPIPIQQQYQGLVANLANLQEQVDYRNLHIPAGHKFWRESYAKALGYEFNDY